MTRLEHKCPVRFARQRGAALILALVFMALLSMLGAVVLQVTNREIKQVSGQQGQAGLFQNKEAFYLVDRTVEYALNTRVLQAINDKITAGVLPIINFKTENTTNALGNAVAHEILIRAGGLAPNEFEGTVRQLDVVDLSINQINRISPGASLKDIFIRYHLVAEACPANVNCASFPKEKVRVDAHLIEVRPNPSGSGGSSEESGDTIWGNPST